MINDEDEKDGHENDLVRPAFRFHPTEEKLIDFYLCRKVEGKCFSINLIAFLDLYHYDPWELPGSPSSKPIDLSKPLCSFKDQLANECFLVALVTIEEKQWFFYIPRDRKYCNDDQPDRVTTSEYLKAIGADRVIRSSESLRSIGLKKTLVFYYDKAPKGIRSSWIMNEYHLPHCENH